MGDEVRTIQQCRQFRPYFIPGRRMGDHFVRYSVDADAERVDRVHRIDQLLEQHGTMLVHHGDLDQPARPLHHAARLGIDVERPHQFPRFLTPSLCRGRRPSKHGQPAAKPTHPKAPSGTGKPQMPAEQFHAPAPTTPKPELYSDLASQLEGMLAGESDLIANTANMAAVIY